MTYNFLETQGREIDEVFLQSVEDKYGFVFPETLRTFFLNHYDARIYDKEIIFKNELSSVVRFIYPEDEKGSFESLVKHGRKYNEIPLTYIPFALTWSAGIYYCDSTDGKICISFPDSLENEYVCDNIEEFFEMLNDEDIERTLNMKKTDYLPLGSIVLLNGATQKLLVISRALNVDNAGKTYFFDYGAVAYPEGLVGDEMAYFNHENIEKVIFKGYSDIDDEVFVERINAFLSENTDIVKGSVDIWEN